MLIGKYGNDNGIVIIKTVKFPSGGLLQNEKYFFCTNRYLLPPLGLI